MGNDGGSFQTRTDLVKEKPREVKIDNIVQARFRAKLCTLSKQRLKKPIVMCRIGNLYNFETVLKFLMEKKIPQQLSHIRKIKDVKEVNLQENIDKNSEYKFFCPLTQIDFNGMNKFVGLWSCGCVFSEKLLEMETLKNQNKLCPICPVCSKPYKVDELIKLISSEEDKQEKKLKILKKQQQRDTKHKQQIQDAQEVKEVIQKQIKTDKDQDDIQQQQQQFYQPLALTQPETKDTDVYKSLFHNDKDIKKEENLFIKNVRFGIR
ncbi:hypothetical protein IMG5_081230 [Ichthyophthirius multifiliis]|uniref:Replication termination factor 2 n=1 Tax=Ichthyophthirius multifiliis TaxID=5932 RepID=G0QQM2_ICHMU|nr:hypothetical protein IMG5_081230 [Ichthyophthirius multifiliis]EGR32489.1 hypothetical protein IMG5_081230 [Ichthyophthirius multifiliis]|eukprot:XP_004036475.1 hypothetical protein IMG5_081230 [Ichthyophthirius multifiliis]